MARFIMTIPDELLPDILEAFAFAYPIPVDDNDIPIMSSGQNAKIQLRRFVREVYITYNTLLDVETARLAATSAAEIASSEIEVNNE